ncbi:hypothetical protein AVEN_121418-1, partial [Araneus ventricosus]
MISVQQAQYTMDLQWNRVSNLEPTGAKADTLKLGHRGSWKRERRLVCSSRHPTKDQNYE